MKKMLFVIHDNYQEFNHIPIGQAYISAALIEKGVHVETYCMDAFHYSNDDLSKHLDDNEYDFIALGFLAARYDETVRPLARTINKHKKKALFIVGGHMPSADPSFVMNDLNCDEVYRGEIVNIKEYDHPAWDIFPMEEYINNFKAPGMVEGDKMLSMVTSTGCINKCSFCYRMSCGMNVRPIQHVVDEMQTAMEKYGVNYFYLLDELFVTNKKRVFDFEERVKGLGIKFACEARADIFDNDIARSLVRSGCQFVNIGFESGTQGVLDEIGKNVTVEQNINTLEVCKNEGIPTGLNFIWGFREDDKKTLFKNVSIIKKYNSYIQVRTIRPVTPYPGTEIYYKAIKEGKLTGANDFFKRFKNSDRITVNFTRFSEKQCYEWLQQANEELIADHHEHKPEDNAIELIGEFRKLYECENYKFRGARVYKK